MVFVPMGKLGLVIPLYRENHLVRVKIRRPDEAVDEHNPKYHIVKGGVARPIVCGEIGKPVILIEAELDAMLLHQFAGDICCPLAIGGTRIQPDKGIHKILTDTSAILFALDFDEAGKKAFKFWQSLYSHLCAWPVPKGKSPGDAYGLGINLRSWVLAGFKRVGIIILEREGAPCLKN